MRIAVILSSSSQSGGGFQQELSTMRLFCKHSDAYEFIFYTTERKNVEELRAQGIPAKYLNARSVIQKIYARLNHHASVYHIMKALGMGQAPFEGALIKDGIDLVFFLSPAWLALSISRFQYVLTVWDQCHRDQMEFPEVSSYGEFERREFFNKNALNRALAVLVDSDLSRANILRRYGCDADRVHIAKFLPSVGVGNDVLIDVRAKYSILGPYLFYPAQFWPHKNHVYILDAVDILRRDHGITVDVVFAGHDRGNRNYVLDHARRLGLERAVHCVGFVTDDELASFYKQALALVMPTYFGPTNIPPLEAFALGCPVCYSDLPGLRDQVGPAAFLMDLNDPSSLAHHVNTLLNDPVIVQEKVRLGKELLAAWNEDDYWSVVKDIFDQYRVKMKCWKGM